MNRMLPIAAICLAAAMPVSALAQESQRTVTVTGSADVTTAPDMATLNIGVSVQKDAASDAMEGVAAAIGPVLGKLAEQGIEARDVQTTALDLSPVYRVDPNDPERRPIADGYRASTMLTVRVRDLGKLGGVIDAVVDEGANELQGLSLGVQNPEQLYKEAQKAAVQDALAKAGLFAEAAGLSLGPVVSISETGSMPMPKMTARAMEMSAGAPPIAEGEVSLSARVSMVVELAD